MSKEQSKNNFEIDGTTVYDTGDEFVFYSKNKKEDEIKHHMSKKNPFPVDNKDRSQDVNIEIALKAAVNFPDVSLREALKKLSEKTNKNQNAQK